MGSFFEVVFPDVTFNLDKDTQVCCPFPHHTTDGTPYFESRPSAGINIDKGVFHCFVCGAAHSEISFAAHFLQVKYEEAVKLTRIINDADDLSTWKHAVQNLHANEEWINRARNKLHFSDKIIEELQIGYEAKDGLSFPIIMFGKVVDVATYRQDKIPKVIRRTNSMSGLITPYDIWVNDKRATIICAGEKDMITARDKGFNAISITGGEGAIPKITKDFANRNVYIVYDNDQAGIDGAGKVALSLYKLAKKIVIVDISKYCPQKGEDVWDFFNKYRLDEETFKQMLKEGRLFQEEEMQEIKEKQYPTITLHTATQPQYVGRTVRSNIQVVGSIDTQFSLPSSLSGHKFKLSETEGGNKLKLNEKRQWYLTEHNLKDVLYLIDSNLKEEQINVKKRFLLGISAKEDFVDIREESKRTAYKNIITDSLTTSVKQSITPMEISAYVLDTKLENGKKYRITYKLVPHPFDGQKLTMIITDVEPADDFLTSFKMNPEKIEALKVFRQSENQSVQDKINESVERIKGLLKMNYDNDLLLITDLWFHTVLEFNVGHLKNIRGYLDTIIVGETRIGKSTSAKVLQETYGVSMTVQLQSATLAGLIGGSKAVGNSYQTRAGLIPQNHKGGLIFEELGKAKYDLMKEITDIKTSNKVTLVRVSGTLEFPALVRTLTITNPKSFGHVAKPITAYPNGIAVLTDLIGTAEDIARFDIIAIFAYKADKPIDPFFEPMEPYTEFQYQTKIRWIWSRSADQVIISKDVYQYVTERANEINKDFDSYIKIFGIEAWKKIMRVAISIAAYVVSTDETFENIIVTKEHIDCACNVLLRLYDNSTFRLREYIKEERSLRDIDAEGVSVLQELYQKNPTLVLHLFNTSTSSRNQLITLSGMPNDDFNKFVHELVANRFVALSGFDIIPTERFRKGMHLIDQTIRVEKPKIVFTMDDTRKNE